MRHHYKKGQRITTMRGFGPVAVISAVGLLFFSPSEGAAQACRPDRNEVDKITKTPRQYWTQVVWRTSAFSSAMSDREGEASISIGRYGAANAIGVHLLFRDAAPARAMLESTHTAAVGDEIQFGFKDAPPIAVKATEVANVSKVDMMGKVGRTVTLSAVLSDQQMALLRDQLSSSPIDAYRVQLTGGRTVEEKAAGNGAQALQRKFKCFYETIEKTGVELAAWRRNDLSDVAQRLAGVYTQRNSADTVFLQADGTARNKARGKEHAGAFTMIGDTLLSAYTGVTVRSIVSGDSLVSLADGSIWFKSTMQAPPANAPSADSSGSRLTIDLIVQMLEAKLPDDVIMATIRKSTKVDVDAIGLVRLKNLGVADSVLRAITTPKPPQPY